MEKKGIIINLLAVLVVLGIVFFSQQSSFKDSSAKDDVQAGPQASNYWQQAQNWLKTHVYPKASVEVEKRGGELQQAALQQKDAAVKNIWERIKIYFAEKFSKFSGTKVE